MMAEPPETVACQYHKCCIPSQHHTHMIHRCLTQQLDFFPPFSRKGYVYHMSSVIQVNILPHIKYLQETEFLIPSEQSRQACIKCFH